MSLEKSKHQVFSRIKEYVCFRWKFSHNEQRKLNEIKMNTKIAFQCKNCFLRQNPFFLFGKHSKKRFAFFVIFIFAFFIVCILSFLLSCNIDESGYASNFDEIPGIQDERIFDDRIIVENDLFFYRTGFLSNYGLYIIGKFTSETTSMFFDNPSDLGLPSPIFSYQDQESINSFPLALRNIPIPTDIADKLKLHRENKIYYSDIDDYLVLFEICHKKFHIQIYLLGKSGYFVISVTHYTR